MKYIHVGEIFNFEVIETKNNYQNYTAIKEIMEPIEDIINVSSKNTEENNNTSKRTGQWIKKPSDNPKSTHITQNNTQNSKDKDNEEKESLEQLDDINNIPKDIKFFIE